MYIRITSFSYDPDREDEFIAIADAARDEMKAIGGLPSAVIVRVGDGESITIGAYDSFCSAVVCPESRSI